MPDFALPDHTITRAQLESVLGSTVTSLIHTMIDRGAAPDENVYMVGGGVRDLLLKRRTLDIDFMIEAQTDGAAFRFADKLQAHYGGDVTEFKPFGTAKWLIDQTVADALGLPLADLPDHIDFAAARGETYEYPTALPTTFRADLKTDLKRRDFTINTLAIRLSQSSDAYSLIDLFGGIQDLRDGVLRVLHDASFIDDPTRILRGARFEQRFGFAFDAHTTDLITQALPMLGKITGERVRNELTLLLDEPQPENALLKLDQRGILRAISSTLKFDSRAAHAFEHLRSVYAAYMPDWATPIPALNDFYWHLIGAFIPLTDLQAACARLLMGKTVSDSLSDVAYLVQNADYLNDAHAKPSDITTQLEKQLSTPLNDTALMAAWLALSDQTAKSNLERFARQWRHTRPTTTGDTLKQLGLKPGKCYGIILARLRAARLDSEVISDDQERALLNNLIEKDVCRDNA